MEKKNKITLLAPTVYNKIAAGEVVGRPANVVKELIENSIDAGASEIVVSIKEAGKKLIQVSDNGIGMNEEDALLSVKRHATSKITSADDLERIGTFGFRGEALSSIAAVSNLVIKTNEVENSLGTIVIVDENGNAKAEKDALPKGTTVIVKNLFYNVPARRNFLKSDRTEFRKILEVFNFIALAYPEISFKLFKDGNLFADYSSAGLHERMRAIFGKYIIEMTIELEEKTEIASFFGFIAKPTYLTDSKNNQHLYVNGRYVKNKTVNNAVFSAYENLLAKGEYPFFVLFITIDPELIDINIHPAKEEIRFYDDAQIFSLVKSVIKKALGSYDFIVEPKPNEEKETDLKLIINDNKKTKKVLKENSIYSGKTDFTDDSELELLFGKIDKELGTSNKENADPTEKTNKNIETSVFYVHKKYLVTEIKSGLMIIDVHLAHKKILYEKALNMLKKGMGFPQQLLFAETITLPNNYVNVLQKFDSKLSQLGFEIKYFGNNKISISGVPSEIKQGKEKTTLFALLNALEKYGEGNIDKILAETFAEVISYKEGDEINKNEVGLIIDQLFALPEPQKTFEGKQIFAKISLSEIRNKFEQ